MELELWDMLKRLISLKQESIFFEIKVWLGMVVTEAQASLFLHSSAMCACVAPKSTENVKGASSCPMLAPCNSLSLCKTTFKALQSS